MPPRGPAQLDLFNGAAAAPATPAPRRRAAAGRQEPVGPSPQPPEVQEVGAHLPRGVFLGTSSWTFPGWEGLVYDRAATQVRLAREGLAAYAHHPVLRTVGIDRTFYGPITAATFSTYAAQVPEGFRFLAKAHEACTLARYPLHERYGQHRGQDNPRFLDAAYARDAVVAPFVEGLGEKAGPLVFQFPPQDVAALGGAERFVQRLHHFLQALPRGPLYAVELRNEALLTGSLAAALADVGASPVLAAWRNLPEVEQQAQRTRALDSRALVVRWMLPPHLGYDEARARYAPFRRLVDEDLTTREALARLSVQAVRAGRAAFVIINNKAEGSAPLSALKLAESIVLENSAP
ncbi:MAG TPA: DUF72 domain-containing protein [Aggregicoccus sp.]|nr:DUF72 domain-containing protein [Aggregicoccus sp.]